jgi:hypothetical protein
MGHIAGLLLPAVRARFSMAVVVAPSWSWPTAAAIRTNSPGDTGGKAREVLVVEVPILGRPRA